jgi:phosphosulfolactate synthase (CoM biosynthesis protein A)
MDDSSAELAFSSVLPIIEPRPKPREVGLTEVRTPAHGLNYIRDYVEMLGAYLDSVKWAVGTQRLVTRANVLAVNTLLAEHQIAVSTGGLLESVLPHGERAVHAFLDEAAELGFTIVEISTGNVVLPVEDKCSIVRATLDAGLLPKPEVFGASPFPGGYAPGSYISSAKILHECEALIEAGAWKVMIEETGIFDGRNPDNWRRDLAWSIATRIPQPYLYWEASSIELAGWLLTQFGPDVNIFTGPEWLGYIASGRVGAFGTAGRIARFDSSRDHDKTTPVSSPHGP